MTEQEAYLKHLNRKFPDINPVEGESLNLEAERRRLFTKAWNDVVKYPRIEDVSAALGLSPRSMFRISEEYGLPGRKDIKSEKKGKTTPFRTINGNKPVSKYFNVAV